MLRKINSPRRLNLGFASQGRARPNEQRVPTIDEHATATIGSTVGAQKMFRRERYTRITVVVAASAVIVAASVAAYPVAFAAANLAVVALVGPS